MSLLYTEMSDIANGRVLEYLTQIPGYPVWPVYPVFENTGETRWPNVTGPQIITGGSTVQRRNSGAWQIGGGVSLAYGYGFDQTITGSEVSYRPPPGTIRVIYRFSFTISGDNPIIQIIPEIEKIPVDDGTPVGTQYENIWQGITAYRTTIRGYAYEGRETIEFPIAVNSTSFINGSVGRLGPWNSLRRIRLNALAYGTAYQARIHGTRTWNGSGDTNTPARPDNANRDTSVSEPILSIIAIGGN